MEANRSPFFVRIFQYNKKIKIKLNLKIKVMKLSEELVIEIVNNNEDLLFEKFDLDDNFDYYIGEELCDDFVGIGYDNGDRGVAFMDESIDLDFETCEDSGVIELDGFKIKYVTFVS
jgi:hypothetical protein